MSENLWVLLILFVMVALAYLSIHIYWYPPENPTVLERINTWQSEFGLPAYIFTNVSIIVVYGIVLTLLAFGISISSIFPVQQGLMLTASIGISYFYFSKKREISSPLTTTLKVFSDMRFSAIFLGAFGITGNFFCGIPVANSN